MEAKSSRRTNPPLSFICSKEHLRDRDGPHQRDVSYRFEIVQRQIRDGRWQLDRYVAHDGDHGRIVKQMSGLPRDERYTSISTGVVRLKPSMITRLTGLSVANSSRRSGSGAPRSSCMRAHRWADVTRTSVAPALRCS